MSKISIVFCLLFCTIVSFNVSYSQQLFYFDSGSCDLNEDTKRKLDLFIFELKSNNNYDQIEVIGHTDNDGNNSFNNRLGYSRARAVMKYLFDKNLSNRIHIISKGEENPLNKNGTPSQKSKNRRVEIQKVDANNNFSIIDKQIQEFFISPLVDTLITGDLGTQIKITNSTFKDVYLDSLITIRLQEFYEKGSFVENRLTTLTTSNKILESRGMIHITAFQGEKELELNLNSSIDILFRDREEIDMTQIFYAAQRDNEVIWEDIEPIVIETGFLTVRQYYISNTTYRDALGNIVVKSTDTIFSPRKEMDQIKSYNDNETRDLFLTSTKLGWINCDRFWNYNGLKKDIYVKTDEDLSASVSLVFNDINVVLPYTYKDKSTYVFKNIPVDQNVQIIGLSKNIKDSLDIKFASLSSNTSSTEKTLQLVFQKKTMGEIQIEMKQLK